MSDDQSDALLRRIRALMAKAASTDSEHEAAALTSKVRELMAEHQLTMEDVTQQNARDPLGCTSVVLPYDGVPYQEVAWRLGAFLGCFATTSHEWVGDRRRRVARFWGREGARVSCAEMLPYLYVSCTRAGNRLSREQSDAFRGRADAIHQTMYALAHRLIRLAAESPASSPVPGALVPVPEAEAWAREQLGRVRETRCRIEYGSEAREAAERISLAGQVGERADSTRMLTHG